LSPDAITFTIEKSESSGVPALAIHRQLDDAGIDTDRGRVSTLQLLKFTEHDYLDI
jgi:hypothetical protein